LVSSLIPVQHGAMLEELSRFLYGYTGSQIAAILSTRKVIDVATSHSTKAASGQVAGYPAKAGIQLI